MFASHRNLNAAAFTKPKQKRGQKKSMSNTSISNNGVGDTSISDNSIGDTSISNNTSICLYCKQSQAKRYYICFQCATQICFNCNILYPSSHVLHATRQNNTSEVGNRNSNSISNNGGGDDGKGGDDGEGNNSDNLHIEHDLFKQLIESIYHNEKHGASENSRASDSSDSDTNNASGNSVSDTNKGNNPKWTSLLDFEIESTSQIESTGQKRQTKTYRRWRSRDRQRLYNLKKKS
ncbi:hypothetical protein F5Y09DRAFT_342423 [Xylaria sp. FL1042]|nr:hypothetical protein F5Y09DRAFT_342423 [Xylaria sp. FL1042]